MVERDPLRGADGVGQACGGQQLQIAPVSGDEQGNDTIEMENRLHRGGETVEDVPGVEARP